MDKIIGIGIIALALIIIITSIIGIASYDYFYDMKVNNCEDIMKTDYQVSTSGVSDCIKFQNYPFYEYTLIYIIGLLLIIFFEIVLTILIGVIITIM